ncbi:MAG: bifunctional diaminohydroxyphosphoribosylaminopyrimidine deaminase/5-amino-6-(5-phosphoribosylamino)uracil reductase RibD [Muribaculaceae bacterium]|nr:bifunctional diaminohydroxyphosphoribosylaminopyrimidine deaminase/5-amino-6-(5-phosphoribosylamino)uracil reductase RibD [Muribaculaceae bacterium]
MRLSDEAYMRRALQLAALGRFHASPNPMVGAVIVAPDGRVIGEGWHRQCGCGHAEVNTVASVTDPALLRTSTMYVTLEPCSHWGRTPPCARLLIDKGVPRVVVAARDPFPAVSGRGIAMLREAGVDVTVGVLEQESLRLNARFITAHTLKRPFTILKWAQSRDGFLDRRRQDGCDAARISTPLTSTLMHNLRSRCDAILAGSGTVLADDPRLDARLWPGGAVPRPVVLDRRRRVDTAARCMREGTIVESGCTAPGELLPRLYAEYGITSLLVEGGTTVLQSFIDSGLWDAARVETSPEIFGELGAVSAPRIAATPSITRQIDGRRIDFYAQNPLLDVKNL